MQRVNRRAFRGQRTGRCGRNRGPMPRETSALSSLVAVGLQVACQIAIESSLDMESMMEE